VKLETRTPTNRGTMNIVAIEYKSYRWNLPLPDSFFDLPRGARISTVNLKTATLPGRKP